MRLIIETTLDAAETMEYIKKVVRMGRVSTSKHGPCYCFVTSFGDGVMVCSDRLKSGTDKFSVYKGK